LQKGSVTNIAKIFTLNKIINFCREIYVTMQNILLVTDNRMFKCEKKFGS